MLRNLIMKRLHACPMDLRPEVMLRVVAVVEPGPVVELVVGAHAPGERLIRVTSIVPVIPVQIGEAVTEIVKRKKKTNVTPVEKGKSDECRDNERELQDAPECLTWILPLHFLENRLGILAEEAEEGVFERMLRGSIVTVFVNRNPIPISVRRS